MRLQGKGNHLQTEMSPVNAAAKTTGQPAPLLPKKSASPSLTIQYRIFYEARLLKWDCWRRQKLLQVKIALWLLQQRRKPKCHYHRSWHRCWCDSHSINSRNLLPLLAQITGLSGTELHCYIYIYRIILVEFVGLLVTLLPLCYCYYESILYGVWSVFRVKST